jgi:hypothetical protein
MKAAPFITDFRDAVNTVLISRHRLPEANNVEMSFVLKGVAS